MSEEDLAEWMTQIESELENNTKLIVELDAITDSELKASGHHSIFSLLDNIIIETEKMNNE